LSKLATSPSNNAPVKALCTGFRFQEPLNERSPLPLNGRSHITNKFQNKKINHNYSGKRLNGACEWWCRLRKEDLLCGTARIEAEATESSLTARIRPKPLHPAWSNRIAAQAASQTSSLRSNCPASAITASSLVELASS
jgi:hypothetical protein